MSKHAGVHFGGLRAAASACRQQCSPKLLRRLRDLDVAFAVQRHITEASVAAMMSEIVSLGESDVPEHTPQQQQQQPQQQPPQARKEVTQLPVPMVHEELVRVPGYQEVVAGPVPMAQVELVHTPGDTTPAGVALGDVAPQQDSEEVVQLPVPMVQEELVHVPPVKRELERAPGDTAGPYVYGPSVFSPPVATLVAVAGAEAV